MIVRFFEQRDNSFTDETLLGIIRQDKTLIIFSRELGGGALYKTGNDCIRTLRYLRFLITKCRYKYISSISV